jgi:hypothetical protein
VSPWYHAVSTAKRYGGAPENYIEIHNWFDETKRYTGDFRHRALRHHSAGVEWAIEKFGHTVLNSDGRVIPVKVIAEQHIVEDCGFIPTPQDYLKHIDPPDWMLRVATRSRELEDTNDNTTDTTEAD